VKFIARLTGALKLAVSRVTFTDSTGTGIASRRYTTRCTLVYVYNEQQQHQQLTLGLKIETE